jgi:hypothetical protein
MLFENVQTQRSLVNGAIVTHDQWLLAVYRDSECVNSFLVNSPNGIGQLRETTRGVYDPHLPGPSATSSSKVDSLPPNIVYPRSLVCCGCLQLFSVATVRSQFASRFHPLMDSQHVEVATGITRAPLQNDDHLNVDQSAARPVAHTLDGVSAKPYDNREENSSMNSLNWPTG